MSVRLTIRQAERLASLERGYAVAVMAIDSAMICRGLVRELENLAPGYVAITRDGSHALDVLALEAGGGSEVKR